MEIKAVILDFGGTLADGGLDWDPYHENIRSYLSSHGYFMQMNVMKKALRGALAELNRFRAKGKEMTFEEVYSIFLSNLDVRYDREMLDYLHDNFRKHYRTQYFPCVEDVLTELSSKYKVALLSNTMSDQPKILLREAGFDKYFDAIYCSRDLGVRKPNPKIFDIVLKELGVHPENAVHVGDSALDVDSLVEAGRSEDEREGNRKFMDWAGRPVDELVKVFSDRYPDRPQEYIEMRALTFSQVDPEVYRDWVGGTLDAYFDGYDGKAILESIKCPTLVLQAENGMISLDEVIWARSMNDEINVKQMGGMDHWLGIRDGRETAVLSEIINFLYSF